MGNRPLRMKKVVRRNLLKNDVHGIVVGKYVFGATVLIVSRNILGVEKRWRHLLSRGCRSSTEDGMKENV